MTKEQDLPSQLGDAAADVLKKVQELEQLVENLERTCSAEPQIDAQAGEAIGATEELSSALAAPKDLDAPSDTSTAGREQNVENHEENGGPADPSSPQRQQ